MADEVVTGDATQHYSEIGWLSGSDNYGIGGANTVQGRYPNLVEVWPDFPKEYVTLLEEELCALDFSRFSPVGQGNGLAW